MNSIFQFGEHHESYAIKVINEREARAGAGSLLFCAMVAFMQAWLPGNFNPTKIVVIGFFIDFFIRVIINPRFSPSLILGRFAVNNQTPEYVGAAQKRLAWGLGLGLASLMMVMLVIYDVRGPVNIMVCLVCHHVYAQSMRGKSATHFATDEVVAKLPQFQSLVEMWGIFATGQKKMTS